MRGRYLLLSPSRRRPEIRAPFTRVRRGAGAPDETQREPAPELRARHRHEALLAYSVVREQEIDPTPSSRPDARTAMGIGAIEIQEEDRC